MGRKKWRDNADKIEAAVGQLTFVLTCPILYITDQSKKSLEILEEYETFVLKTGLEGIFSTNVQKR